MSAGTGHGVTWYFDFVSPFAYLQWQAVRALPTRVKFCPILFAALLKHHGHKGPAEIDAKRLFTYRHALWRAQDAGIHMAFPPAHPFNPLPALRLCIGAGVTTDAIDTLFNHIWREGHRGDDAASLREVGHRLGIADVESAIDDPANKARLARNTHGAVVAGVFGVPTLVVDGQLFWGDDATGMFRDFMADPALFDTPAMRRLAGLPVGARRGGAQ